MRLITLRLRNFKGVQEFSFDARGNNVTILGRNGTGKTTVADAFSWLLFDKDSRNQKQFEIKTLDADGQPIHGLEHEVEALLELPAGKRVTLRKVYKEKWTKKRGQATAELTGHTTDHFIDDVPVSKSKYAAKVAEIADEEICRLLTDPRYFCEVLHWEKRRALLLDVCGDITDAEVIASDEQLAALPGILGDRTLDEHRAMVQASRRKINEALKQIPARIDEVQRGLPELPEIGRQALEAQLAELREKRNSKEQERSRMESGGEIAEKRRRLAEVEAELLEIERKYRSLTENAVQETSKRLSEASDLLDAKQREVRNLDAQIQDHRNQIERFDRQVKALRKQWHQHNDQTFEYEQSETCPTCGQALPAEQVEAAREKALAEFNAVKAAKLERITAEGKELRGQIRDLEAAIEDLMKQRQKAETELARAEQEAAQLHRHVNELRDRAPDATQDAAYQAKVTEKQSLEQEIAQLRAGNTAALDKVTGQIEALDQEITTTQAQLARFDEYDRGQKRIQELRDEERRLAADYEQTEYELHLCDLFTRAKVRLLDDKINSRFQHARFKLFKENINGGIEPCCEVLYAGVPYGTNLNTGARVLVGLDIINTLADHYGFAPPVFVDNAESVSEFPEIRAQLIKLVQRPDVKKLRVEIESQTKAQKEAV